MNNTTAADLDDWVNGTDTEWSDGQDNDGAILFQFITNGILLNFIGLLGIVGNVISMIILSRPQMRSSINYLLIGLARCDTVLIITSVLLFGIPAIYVYTKSPLLFIYFYKVYPFLSSVVYPLALIAQTVSVYLTLTVTLERFVAVCHPLQARSLCTYGRARLYVILIIIFSTFYNLSRFWEVTILSTYSPHYNTTLFEVIPSPLRMNPLYIKIYTNWLYLIFIYFLPFTCLAVLNGAIYRQVRKANKERQRLSRLQKKEIGLATMLLIVVVVFVLCNVLALVANILEEFYGVVEDRMVKTSNLLVTFNSSVNFIIYVIFGEKFKRLFLKLFCSHGSVLCGGGRDSPDCHTLHEDSIMISNGDLRHSVRRTNGSIKRQSSRAIPCVYYPQRNSSKWSDSSKTTITTLSQL